jgi:sugar phosphate isomerase/epimerase
MQLIVFTKFLKDKDARGLIDVAKQHRLDGFDLCVRDGYVVNPQNAKTALPELVKTLAAENVAVPMVTGPGDLVRPDHKDAETILAAMNAAGVRVLKLGYVLHDPAADYWQHAAEVRAMLAGWEKLAAKHGVTIVCHTHSCHDHHCYMGLNCAGLMHLLRDFDPRYIGAYIDAGHMTVDGEPFAFGVSMVRKHLAAVALKDVLISRQPNGDEGRKKLDWVPAGEGLVAWSEVFAELRRIQFAGPVSVHCEFETTGPDDFRAKMAREIAYFRRRV